MQLVFKFKDGVECRQDYETEVLSLTAHSIVEAFMTGKQRNSNITITDSQTGQVIERKYEDLHSIEVVLN